MKYSRLIFANLFRKKARLILTIGSFAVALFLFTFLAVVKGAFSRGTELAGADRLVVINRVGLINTMPLAHGDRIRQIKGVKFAPAVCDRPGEPAQGHDRDACSRRSVEEFC